MEGTSYSSSCVSQANIEDEWIHNVLKNVMDGKWKEAALIFIDTKRKTTMITRSGETILHLAAEAGKTDIIEMLLSVEGKPGEILMVKNERGETPLHHAVAQREVDVVRCLVRYSAQLVIVSNCNGETPLFTAARHGKKSVFLYLHSIIENSIDPQYINKTYFYRRKDGNTILHCAILGEYFG